MKTTSIALGFLLLSTAVVAQQYVISTVAGGAPPPTPIAGVNASISSARGVAVDAAGNVYFTTSDLCVFKLDRNGTLTRIAGNSRSGYSGDGGPALNAQFSLPWGVAVDSTGNIYIADGAWIRRISPNGGIGTVAGSGTSGAGDGGQAVNAQLNSAYGVAVDASGNLFIADAGAAVIRRVSSNGIITTVAGNGIQGYSGDGGLATNAELYSPVGVALDSSGDLYIADKGNNRIRKISPDGIITTVAGNGGLDTQGGSGDGGPATSAQLSVPIGIAVDNAGSLYIAQDGDGVRKVASGGIISTVVSNIAANGVVPDNTGNLYLATGLLPGGRLAGSITRVSSGGIVTTLVGTGNWGYSGDGGPAVTAQLNDPLGVAVDTAGNVYIADVLENRVRKVAPSGIITTVAGNGTHGLLRGDGGPATSATLHNPAGVAVDGAGNLFIGEEYLVRKVSPGGIITTVAGGSPSPRRSPCVPLQIGRAHV